MDLPMNCWGTGARSRCIRLHGYADAPKTVNERILEHTFTYALIESAGADYLRDYCSKNPPIRALSMALIARDQMDGGNLQAREILPLLDDRDLSTKESATWIAGHHPEWGEQLAAHFNHQFDSARTIDDVTEMVFTSLLPHVNAPAIQKLLAEKAYDSTLDAQIGALRVMASAKLKEIPAAWINAVNHALTSSDAKVLTAAVAAARSFPPPKKGVITSATELAMLARKTELPDDLRLNAHAARRACFRSTRRSFISC